MAARFLLEEIEDRRGGVRTHGEQGFVDQRQTQLGLDRLADLVGHGDFHLAVLAGQEGFLERFHDDLQLALDGEFLGGGAQVAAIDGGRGEAEIGEQVMAHLERDVVVVLVQIDNLIAQDRFAFVGQQGEAFVQARVQAHLGILADLEGGLVGEQAEFVGIVVVGNLDAWFRG